MRSDPFTYPIERIALTRTLLVANEHDRIPIPAASISREGRLSLYGDVLTKDLVRVSSQGAHLTVHARGFVGVFPLNDDFIVEVRPRMPASSVERLVKFTGASPELLLSLSRSYKRDDTEGLEPLEVLFRGLLTAVEEIIGEGRIREYRSVSGLTSFPKGKILLGRTLRDARARGRSDRLAVSWSAPTADCIPNRYIKLGLVRLGALANGLPYGVVDRKLRLRLALAAKAFSDVPAASVGGAPPMLLQRSHLTAAYQRALSIVDALVAGNELNLRTANTDLELPVLVVNMADVFEQYVRRVLQIGLGGSEYRVIDGNKGPPSGGASVLFDVSGDYPSPPTNPDCLIEDGARATVAIVEVKYKPYGQAPERDDINQCVTYSAAYGCAVAWIVHLCSRKRAHGAKKLGVLKNGVTVYSYAFDLESNDIAAREAEMVAEIADKSGLSTGMELLTSAPIRG